MSAPRLTDSDVKKAVQILDGWTGKLTWDRMQQVLDRYPLPPARIVHQWSRT